MTRRPQAVKKQNTGLAFASLVGWLLLFGVVLLGVPTC